MNYLSFVNQMSQYSSNREQLNYLVSGADPLIKSVVSNDIFTNLKKLKKQVILLDDASDMLNAQELRNVGFSIENGLAGYTFCNIFDSSIKGRSRLRCVLDVLDYTEQRKQKLIAYLNFIMHIQSLKENEELLNVDIMAEYSSNMFVEEKIQQLQNDGIINQQQQIYLLSKYSEVCGAAADFEDTLFSLAPFIKGDPVFDNVNSVVKYIKVNDLANDVAMKRLVAQMVSYAIEDSNHSNTALVVLDKGRGDRKYLMELISSLTDNNIEMHIISDDIFTLGSEVHTLLNKFPVRIYSRHNVMDSASMIEKALGEIDIIKDSYTVSYDRRWSANRALDMLLGRNKTETYTSNAPCREPKYKKEMILSMQGCGIVEYKGNSTIFSI